jgi:hypothetical protein
LAKAAVEKIKMGDPKDKDVTLGPLASTKQYKRVQEFIKSGVEEGAELVIGGEGHPQGLERGNFIKPTVFANVTRVMRIAKEEIFGPVLSILTFKTEAEAIEIANDTEFGLIAYVSSADPERAYRVARKLAAGRVLINTVSHDPYAPFWPEVLSNSLEPGWVPTKMGGASAPDDLNQAHLTQAWLATSDDPKACVTGKYFYHLKQIAPNAQANNAALQDRLIRICTDISGVALPV